MARNLADDTYYTVQSKGGKIPVKWTAPEVKVLSIIMACSDHAFLSMKLKGPLLQKILH